MLERINKLIRLPKNNENDPSVHFWKGAFIGVISLALLVMALSGLFFRTGLPRVVMALATVAIGISAFWFFRIIGSLIHKGISKVPLFVFSLIFAGVGIFILAKNIRFGLPDIIFYPGIIISITTVVLLFGSIWVLLKSPEQPKTKYLIAIVCSLLVLGVGTYYFAQEGSNPHPIAFEPTEIELLSTRGIANPGLDGKLQFTHFTYGSGTDKRRAEFREEVKYKSRSVDASRILTDWKGKKAKWRERYWGFGVKEFPLNGRVWMPEGKGPFPIVLIVHGNHGMEEHSDPGYQYLGELLSTRGFITVSVDENFVNGTWSGDFRGKEMPARGWLLLKHLEQWKLWNQDNSHELFGKVDLDNVLLAGHSRGGEAAPIAARFNELDYFPDDANEKFDFHFGIKGVLAIAPTDKRYDRRIDLENVNYLSIQGSYDSDEASFFGFRQYQRVTFPDSNFYFKAGLYVHRANHGQFNSVWGRYDGGPPYNWVLNTQPLIPMEEQQQIAKVYIGAFAEAVLHSDSLYLPLFKNSMAGKDWLPNSLLLNTYKDSETKVLASFEEDIDLTSASLNQSIISTEHLKVWREEILTFRDKDVQGNNAVVLGWNSESDSIKQSPYYQVQLNEPVRVEKNQTVSFLAARGNLSELKSASDKKKENEEEDKDLAELDFTIVLYDSTGKSASAALNDFKKISPQLKIQFLKLKGLNEENFGSTWEPTLESIEIPLSAFEGAEEITHVKSLRFKFDRSPKGVLIVDEIGLGVAR
ncbi:MAG: hypothetical protein RLN86_13315 [Cyclobacteriaceae bacterium]